MAGEGQKMLHKALRCSRAGKICCCSSVLLSWHTQHNCFLAQVQSLLAVTRRQVTLSSEHLLSGREDQV